MKVLVTGSDGMLATAIRNSSQGYTFEISYCNRHELDITDLEKLTAYFATHRFDVIVNCAAYTNVERAESDIEQAYAINATGSRNLAITAANNKIKLLHISTDAVYDGRKNGVYTEDNVCHPLSVYSQSKYAGEQEIQKHCKAAIIIRTSWLYSLDKANFITAIINKAKKDGNLSVVYDQLGTPTYTYDLARAVLEIIASEKLQALQNIEVYHYSNEGAISWYDFSVAICNILNIPAAITPVTSSQYPSKVTRPFQAILSKEKIKKDFNLTIPYWRDSLEKCLTRDSGLKIK